MVGAIASSRVSPGWAIASSRVGGRASHELRVDSRIQARVKELEGLVLSFGVSLGCFGYDCLMSGFIWMLNAGCFIVCMLILFRYGWSRELGAEGTRAGGSSCVVSSRLVLSRLVSSRLTRLARVNIR